MQIKERNRRVALDAAQAVSAVRATGNHLTAQNDEPEPDEAALLAADVARNEGKAERLAQRNDAAALELQVMNLDAMRRAGWL